MEDHAALHVNLDPGALQLDESVFVADTARLIGQVTVGSHSSIWFGVVVRGDVERVSIGERTNLQDGAIVHVDPGHPCIIGDGVTLGHNAIVHAAAVHDNVLVGIGAMVLTGSVVGENCIIGAGAVVPEGSVIPPGSLVLGIPGRVVRPLTAEQIARIQRTAERYTHYARLYRARFGPGHGRP